MKSFFEIGTAKRTITPEMPVPLAGFASRNGKKCEGVKEDIWVRVLRVHQGDKHVILIHGDLIWWDPRVIQSWRKIICERTGYPQSHIIFTATHNHSGPASGYSFVPELGKADSSYIEFLKNQVLDAVEESGRNRTPVICKVRKGICDLNVYRRKRTENGIQMQPNYQEQPDNVLTMITFEDSEGEWKAFGIHYSCHATLCGENMVFTDYPGLSVKMLEENYPNAMGFFWQGCAADLRPNSVLGAEFRRCNYEEAYQFTRQFVHICEEILKKPGEEIYPDLICDRTRVLLPVDLPAKGYSPEEMLTSDDELMRHWAECAIQKRREDLRTEVCRVQFGKGLVFYGISAEAAQDYGKYVRNLEVGAVCCGYTNGMSGYLCTARQIDEGGYEPAEAAWYFGVEGTYSQTIEHILKGTLWELAHSIRHSSLEDIRKEE